MAWVLLALAAATTAVTLTEADKGGYGSHHAAPPIYHAPPPPVSYAAIPIHPVSSGGKKGGGRRGNFLKSLPRNFPLFGGKGSGKGRGGSGPFIAPVHVPVLPPIKQHHLLNVKVPKCQPLTHYITQYITEAHPVSSSPAFP